MHKDNYKDSIGQYCPNAHTLWVNDVELDQDPLFSPIKYGRFKF